MSGIRPNKITLQQSVRGLIAGTQKHFSNETLTFEGATYASTTLVQLLQSLIDAIAESDTTKASWKDALSASKDANAKIVPVLRGYQRYVVNRFGNVPSTLEDFGIAPRKAPLPLTSEQKAAAVAKREATRKARNTMGTRQRAKVKAPALTPANGPPPKPAT